MRGLGRSARWKVLFPFVGLVALVLLCVHSAFRAPTHAISYPYPYPASLPVTGDAGDTNLVMTTGYCNCGRCCGWRKRWGFFGQPVYNYGSQKGRPKAVGRTACGTVTRIGTVAADLSVWKFGTKLDIPGYGEGVVEDVAGAIKGRHIDLWFPSHAEALRWGVRWLKVVPVSEPNSEPEKRNLL